MENSLSIPTSDELRESLRKEIDLLRSELAACKREFGTYQDDVQTAHEELDAAGINRDDPSEVANIEDTTLSLTGRVQDCIAERNKLRTEFIQHGPHGDEVRATVIWQDDQQVTQAMWDELRKMTRQAIHPK